MSSKKLRIFLFVVLISLLIITFGCSTTSSGRKIEKDRVSQIQKGQTTKAEIERDFGSPESKNFSQGEEIWSYRYFETSGGVGIGGTIISYLTIGMYTPSSSENKSQYLSVIFQDGTVKDFTFGEDQSKTTSSSINF